MLFAIPLVYVVIRYSQQKTLVNPDVLGSCLCKTEDHSSFPRARIVPNDRDIVEKVRSGSGSQTAFLTLEWVMDFVLMMIEGFCNS